MQGIGVTADINDPQELAAAVQRAANAQRGGVLVEKHVTGHAHRLLVVDGRLIAASRILPPHVTGDGVHSIEQLVVLANEDHRRGHGFNKLARLALNSEADRVLAKQGRGYAAVPARGRIVFLSGTANSAAGGIATDVTGTVHPDVRDMAELIALAFKLDVAGIDYMTHDIARTFRDGGGAVCDVNACPALPKQWMDGSDHHSTNARRKVVDAVLAWHFPDGQTGRIPLIAVTGSSGTTTTARMVAGILAASGKITALTSSDGVFVGKNKIRGGDCSGGIAASAVLLDPRVEAAVLELGPGSLIRLGIPIDACDIAAVLDVEFDHTRQEDIDSTEALAAVMLLVPRAASHYAVLNADDASCVGMANRLGHVPICWVSLNPGNSTPTTHGDAGGMTATLCGTGEDAEIMIASNSVRQCAVRIRDIPVTSRGSMHVKEALFAVAIAYALDIPLEHIRSGLIGFQSKTLRD